MQKNKRKSKVFLTIVSLALATVLLIGAEISATEKDKLKGELTGKIQIPIEKEAQKKEAVKAPVVFVPTEKVTADQAVAFPTDI